MSLYQNFKTHIAGKFSFLKEHKLVIAISGGVDSVVLAQLCQKLELNFALAHCNFNLRGTESDADEQFVLNLGEILDVEVFVQHFDTNAYANIHKTSIQMAARELRYNWFKDLAKQLQFDYILTAHHADDNLETFLINFTRGTGLNGLTGIPQINENIVRPLLPFSRETIETYAKEHHIEWRNDSSNSSRKYLRNKLRHDVVPILKEINPQVLDSFQNTLNHLNASSDIVETHLLEFIEKASKQVSEIETWYKVEAFTNTNNPKAYLFEVFKSYGFTEWNDLENLLSAQSGKQVFSNTHRIVKHRDYLILTGKNQNTIKKESILIEKIAESIETPIGTLTFETVKSVAQSNLNSMCVDKDKLAFPLELRLWNAGDYFYPLGMKGKKKVSKYLKDEKLSLIEKENIWVLTSNNDIVWVISKRADERYKITENTKQILKLTLH